MFKNFDKFPNLVYGISTKADGSMRLWADAKKDKLGLANRKKFFATQGISFEHTVGAALVHGTNIAVVDVTHRKERIAETDGLITSENNVFLTVTVADCFPVYFFNPRTNTMGLAHTGWRGVVRGTIHAMLKKLMEIDVVTKNLLVGIGPGIQSCHFEVKNDVAAQFQIYPQFIQKRDNKTFVDLQGIIIKQLVSKGIPRDTMEPHWHAHGTINNALRGEHPSEAEHEHEGVSTHGLSRGALRRRIEADMRCTFDEKETFFSWRRDKPKIQEAMVAYIGVKK